MSAETGIGLIDAAQPHHRAAMAALLSMQVGRDILRLLIDRSGVMADTLRNNPQANPTRLAVDVGWQNFGREILLFIADVDPQAYGLMLTDAVQERAMLDALAKRADRTE